MSGLIWRICLIGLGNCLGVFESGGDCFESFKGTVLGFVLFGFFFEERRLMGSLSVMEGVYVDWKQSALEVNI